MLELGDKIEVVAANDVYKMLETAKKDAYRIYMKYKTDGLNDAAQLCYAQFAAIQDLEKKAYELEVHLMEPEDFDNNKVGY